MDAGYRLGEEADQELHDLVDSGEFETREEVLLEGMRLVRRQAERRAKLLELVQPALVSIARGEGIPAKEVFAKLRARYAGDALQPDR